MKNAILVFHPLLISNHIMMQPDETEFEPLSQYCQSARIPVVIVPAGFELTPPQVNSDDEDEDGNIGYNANDINSQLPNQKSVDVFDDLNAWQ